MSDPLYVVVGNRGFEPSGTDGAVPWLWDSAEGAKLKADHLNKFESTKDYYAGAVFIVRKEWVDAVQSRADELDRLRAENERLREALTPSADTKAAYMGEFHMGVTLQHPRTGEEERRTLQIPWDSIKEIMAAIRARAVLKTDGGKE